MKTRTIFSFVLITLFAFQKADANIWRVNNNGFSANFANLQAANNSNDVSDGDTVHLEGSTTLYPYATVSKKLVIIGPGYFLNENPNTSTNSLSALLDYITFNTSSQGSQLIGVYVSGVYGITINASNIVVKRCIVNNYISLDYDISNVRISQNFFAGQSTNSIFNPSPYGFPTNLMFNNNICQKTLILPNGNAYTLAECKNNVFDCPAITNNPSIKINVGSFQNNILKTGGAIVNINNNTNHNVSYNISASANNQFGTANDNIIVPNMTSLFVNAATNTTDGDYQLQPGSPGSNNGSDGTNRGAFGGLGETNRYTLSGLAPIPVIYEINTTGIAGPGGLPVSIKARTIQ